MSRPLLVCDCDEVLMHMVVPFGAWLSDDHDIEFRMEDASFGNALKRRSCGTPLEAAEVWPLLDGFFAREMHRQYAVAGAADALVRLADMADIVILTNIGPDHAPARSLQLIAAAMPYRVIGSRGGKGEPLAALIAEMAPSVVAFVDDLAMQHKSVAASVPDVWRLHMVAEPMIADKIPPSRHAHARIDDWALAVDWLSERLLAGAPAPVVEKDA
jgi:hypothetical protein